MLTEWKLFNFKSVQEETTLELAPLTIFAGPNSSGKSTWIQSILLVSQTLSSKVRSRSVVLNGDVVKLGQFDDIRSFGTESRQILIGWKCEPKVSRSSRISRLIRPRESSYRRASRLKQISCELSFDVDPTSSQHELMQLQPRLFSYTMTCASRSESNIGNMSRISINRSSQAASNEPSKLSGLEISDVDSEVARSSLDYNVDLDQNSLQAIKDDLLSAELIGCTLNHFVPERLAVRFDKVNEKARRVALVISGDRLGMHFSPTFRRSFFEDDLEIPITTVKFLETHLGEPIQAILHNLSLESNQNSDKKFITVQEWHEQIGFLNRENREVLRVKLPDLAEAIYENVKVEFLKEFSTNRDDDLQPGNDSQEEEEIVISSSKSAQYAFVQFPIPEQIFSANSYLDIFFSNYVKYLGPLRDEPKPQYPLAPTADPADVGLRGEHTAAVFELHKTEYIRYIPSRNFPAPGEGIVVTKSITTQDVTLETAVLDWLNYLKVAEGIDTKDKGKFGYELKVKLLGTEMQHDLTHVGVGVSQVLPILVTCLLADADTTLIFEQPELHLHPLVQTRLADFFLSMALLRKQCIVESHSEYMINRLRYRIASAEGDSVKKLMQIYFVDKVNGATKCKPIEISKYGAIENWPEDFFDQSQREVEQILMAGAVKADTEK